MAKDILKLSETSSSQYIQQVAAQEGTYDIVPAHKIKFFNGQEDTSGVVWDGVRDIEVVIPSLADLVKDPIRFAGTVGSDGIPKDKAGATFKAKNGDLVFFTADVAAFETVSGTTVACEAGDMAVYDGSKWNVVSGENQVTINASEDATVTGNDHLFSISGTAKTLLTVEGKSLSVKIDYADVRSKIKVVTNTSTDISVFNATTAVTGMSIALSKSDGTPEDISTSVSFNLPTALSNGAVTISEKVLVSGNFTFNSGAFPVISKNANDISLDVSANMTIGKANADDGENGDYVTSVNAIRAVSFTAATSENPDHTYVGGIVADTSNAKSFVSGIHVYTEADADAVPDFVVPGTVTATSENNTFVTGLTSAANSGDVVSSVTVGAVSIASGTGILTGINPEGSDFISSVTFGSVVEDATNPWFVKGLTDGSDVVTDVTVGATTLVADDTNTSLKSNAIVSASVSNHVLSFTTAAFMTPVKISKAADTITKKGLSKGGVKLTGFESTTAGFTTGSISQADTVISYKSLTNASVVLTPGAETKYYFDKDTEHAYSASMSYVDFSVLGATVTKNSPKLENKTISVSIPANTVAVDVTGGTLPSLTIGTATGTLTGSVNTALSTSEVSFLGVNSAKKSITIPTYTLVSDSTVAGAITVAAAGTYSLADGMVTIPADSFVVDVTVDDSSVKNNA